MLVSTPGSLLYILWMPGMGYINPINRHFRTGSIMEEIIEGCAGITISHLELHLLLDQESLYTQLCNRFQTMLMTCMKSNNVYVQYLIAYSTLHSGHLGKNVCSEHTTISDHKLSEIEMAQLSLVKEPLNVRDNYSCVNFLSIAEVNDLLTYACTYQHSFFNFLFSYCHFLPILYCHMMTK